MLFKSTNFILNNSDINLMFNVPNIIENKTKQNEKTVPLSVNWRANLHSNTIQLKIDTQIKQIVNYFVCIAYIDKF